MSFASNIGPVSPTVWLSVANWECRHWSSSAISRANSQKATSSGRGIHSARPPNEAAEAGVRIALEFQGRASLANNLQTAAALVAETGHPALGICFDVFHYYVGPSKFEDLGYLTTENLFHVQFSDLAQLPRELATDADRILPGDGDFLLDPIVEHLHRSATTVRWPSN